MTVVLLKQDDAEINQESSLDRAAKVFKKLGATTKFWVPKGDMKQVPY
jgi:hypothetical protein